MTRELRAVHVLTMNGRESFDALSAADRAQLTAAGKAILGETSLEATFAWLEREEMALHKVQLVRGDEPLADLWINAALDDGALFEPGTPKPNGIVISQEHVGDTTSSRKELCAEVDAALRRWRAARFEGDPSVFDADLWQS
jgi:hypothetical protein